MVNSSIGKILVVDDEVELKNILVEALTSQGYETSGFTSGEEALAALRGEAFDVLLTDLMMPGMDGITLVRESLQIDPYLVAIVMTGQGTIQTAVDAMKVGAFDYVLKPFRLQTMLPVLTRAMNARHLRLENVQLREAIAIHELSQTIAFTLEPQTVLSKLADAALQQSDADEVSVLLPTADGAEFYVAAVRGEKRERLLGERVPFGQSISGWVARQHTPVILNGEVNDDRFVALWPRPDISSSVSIPMLVAKKLVGVLNLNVVDKPRPFTLGQMKALTILAGTAAAALESASLYTQVQQAEENYRSIFENAIEGVFRGTPDGQKFFSVNPAMAKMFGYDSPAEMVKAVVDITGELGVKPERRDAALRRLSEQGELKNFEERVQRKDGSEIWISANVHAVSGAKDELLYLDGIVQDITERKKAEAAQSRLNAEIREQRERLDTIVATVPGVVFESWGQPNSSEHRTDFVSDYVQAMLGYSAEEWLSIPGFWFSIVHPDDRERVAKESALQFAETRNGELEFRWIAKDKRVVWVRAHTIIVRDRGGRAIGVRGVVTDMTARKRAEEALQQSEILNRSLVEHLPQRIFVKDRNSVYLFCNAKYALDLGTGPMQVVGKDDFAFHPRDLAEGYRADDREVMADGKVKDIEERYKVAGAERWIHTVKVPYRNEQGEIIGVLGLFEDITERKLAEALRELLSALVEASPDFVGFADPKTTHIQYINKHGRKMCGIGEDEDVRKLKISDVHPAWMNKRLADVVLPAAVRDGVWEGEGAFLHRDGREIPVLMSLLARKAANGEVDLLYTISRDITERKRTDDALRESEERYKGLIDSAFDGVLILRDQIIVAANRAYAEMFGYSVEEVIGRDVLNFTAPEYHDLVLAQITQTESTYESVGLRRDGTRIPVEISGQVCMYEGQHARLAAVRDISERKRVEEIQARRATHALFRADVSAALAVSRAPLRDTLDSCAQAMVQHLQAAFARVWTLNREGDVLELQASAGLYTHIDGGHARVPVGSFKIGKIAQERAPHISNSVQIDPEVSDHAWATREGMVAFAGYPLIVEDRLLGVMALFSRQALAEDTLDALASVADVISQGIERKRAEQELSDLVENAQDIIYSHDLQGNYTSSNKAGEEITGYTLAESLKLNLAQTIAPEYVEKAREMLARNLAGEETTAYELELIAKDGHRVPVEVNTRLVMQNGVPVGVTGVAREITDRKRAEAELRRLAAVVEETADSVVITNKQGNIQYVNPAFERITGYTKEEVLNQNPRFLKSGKTDPAVYKELWETITCGDVWTGQLINRRKDGTLFHERMTISAIYDESHEIVNYVAVKQDISDLIQLEEQLRQSQKLEAIGQLAGGVAHDFNNLLTAINGYSSLALQRLEDDHPIRPYLEEVKKAGDRAANLTRQLLAFGRKQILQPLPLNLNSAVSDMNKMLRLLIGEDIQLTAKLDPDVGKVMADPGQIEQVLVNLIVNARDAMPRGGHLTIETKNVELDQEYGSKHVGVAPGKYVLLAVSDTGEGMREEVRRRVFEPFFTTKEKGKGTGLGLSTVYGIVKQSGGNVWVYSEPGKGTTFKVYLPQVESETRGPGETVVEAAPRGGSETILLVEDEEVVRGLARRILEQVGYSVVEASRADEALRFWEEHAREIDLLLTDVVMPEMSGKELADQMKSHCPELKMLFMSGYTDEAIVHHGVLDSSVEFIQKPFTPAGLVKRVRDVLDSNGKSR